MLDFSLQIAIFIFFVSFFGLVFIVIKKIPQLREIPENIQDVREKNFYQKIKNKVSEEFKKTFSKISLESFFHKILSKIRIINLKIENKIANYLQQLREKQKRKKENKSYWQKLKETKKEKK